jgi:hypothetical protein
MGLACVATISQNEIPVTLNPTTTHIQSFITTPCVLNAIMLLRQL